MIIIYAYINASPMHCEPKNLRLIELCNQNGFQAPIYAYSVEGLEFLMERHKEDSILLFTNFPPNSSYPESIKKELVKPWLADSYERTGSFFTQWVAKYRFAGIHVITGAPDDILTDSEIKRYFHDKNVTIIRKGVWIKEGVDFENVFTFGPLNPSKRTIDQDRTTLFLTSHYILAGLNGDTQRAPLKINTRQHLRLAGQYRHHDRVF